LIQPEARTRNTTSESQHFAPGCVRNPLLQPFGWENIRRLRWMSHMRNLAIVVMCTALGGCWTSGQEAATSSKIGDQFVGQNVDAVVARFGKPVGRKKLDNDQMGYVWELAAVESTGDQNIPTGAGGLYGDGRTPGQMSDDPRFCKISVTTSPEGTVTQFNAEDSNGTGAPSKTFGLVGSACAQRLQGIPGT